MEQLLKKRLWVLHLLVLTSCAIFAGRAAAHLIEANYLMDVAPRVRRVAPPPPPRSTHGKEPDAIVERDIFCSGCVAEVQAKAAERAAEDVKKEPQKTALELQLLAILLSTDEDSSAAVIRDLSTKQKDASLFYRGGVLFETGATVDRVFARRVYLRNKDALEYLDLDDKPEPPKPGAPPPRPTVAAAGDALSSAMEHGISCAGPNCQIDRGLVEQLLRNTTVLATSARFVPSIRDGRPFGFRIFAIRSGSLFERIGLQNGDTIRTINGNDMSTPDQALALYSKLRSASHLSVQVDRRGSTTNLDYIIR